MGKERYSIIGINDYYFAINLINLQEVCNIPRITPIPNAPDFMKGVFNLRGNIYGILDFGMLSGIGPSRIQIDSMIIVITNAHYSVGTIASRIHSILSFDEDSFNTDLSALDPDFSRFISSKYKDGQLGEIYILDIVKLLASSELSIYF